MVSLEEIAQDGMRVRACAKRSSFLKEPSLQECLEEAEELVEGLRKEIEKNPHDSQRQKKQRELKIAQQRKQKAEIALQELNSYRQQRVENANKNHEKKPSQKDLSNLKVSLTDPQSRIMKMASGGFRPAYNIQYATDTRSFVIIGLMLIVT